MGIHPADRPILEQDEDSFEAWLKRKSNEVEKPWTFPDEAAGAFEMSK